MFKKIKGFTLIELLVVIAIIAILVVLIILALNSARTRARDSQRKSNLSSIRTGLETYNDENNHYPTNTTPLGGQAAVKCYSSANNCLVNFQDDMRLEKWIEDPSDGNSLPAPNQDQFYEIGYNSDATADNFILGCTLETGNNTSQWGYTIGTYTDEDPIH